MPLLVELPNGSSFEKAEMELRAVAATQAVEMVPVCSCKVNLRCKMEQSTCRVPMARLQGLVLKSCHGMWVFLQG